MARAGWLNENQYRDYPFLTQVKPLAHQVAALVPSSSSSLSASAAAFTDLPHEAVVDFGAIMGLDARFNAARHWVYLYRIERQGAVYIYEFRTNAPGAAGEVLLFSRNAAVAGEHAQQWTAAVPLGSPDPWPDESSSYSASSLSSSSAAPYPFCDQSSAAVADCGGPGCLEPSWEGFLVTGRFEALNELLGDGERLLFDARLWVIEPSRLQNLSKAFARSLNLANTDRTHVTAADVCLDSSAGADDTVFPVAVCLQGELRFQEGYNCAIRQDDSNNTLIFAAAAGAGAGDACGPVPLYPGEAPPGDSQLLTGGPTCGQLITAINGKTGRNIRIEAGAGFQISTDPAKPHQLIVDAVLSDLAACVPQLSSSSGDC